MIATIPVQDAAHLVVLDDFFGEAERESLLHSLTGSDGGSCSSTGPTDSKWERNTADGAHASRTWGLREEALAELTSNPTPAILEIQTRLVSSAPYMSPSSTCMQCASCSSDCKKGAASEVLPLKCEGSVRGS